MRILEGLRSTLTRIHLPSRAPIPFGPFNSSTQKRWKKPVNSAKTRLENRTSDPKLDKLTSRLRKLRIILQIQQLMSHRKRGAFVSVQLMSRWKNILGLKLSVGEFLRKYPHVFDVFTHPARKNLCCRVSRKMLDLIREEEAVIGECEMEAVSRLQKLLMMSKNGILHVHALRLVKRELGLPENFRESILQKHSNVFKLLDLELVELVDRNENLSLAKVEQWREREYTEKWLSEFETRYAFPINFPTGFKFPPGFREKMKNWQRVPYLKPYETKEIIRVRTSGGLERYEKRAVGIIHELLSLTVEKMATVERLAHFKKDFAMELNIRELLLKHPGIFYISTKGNTSTVFLREAYSKGCLVEANSIHIVRRKMLDLVLLGNRHTRELKEEKEGEVETDSVVHKKELGGRKDGDWVVPILEGFS